MKNKSIKINSLKEKSEKDSSVNNRMEEVMEIIERIKSPFPISFGCV